MECPNFRCTYKHLHKLPRFHQEPASLQTSLVSWGLQTSPLPLTLLLQTGLCVNENISNTGVIWLNSNSNVPRREHAGSVAIQSILYMCKDAHGSLTCKRIANYFQPALAVHWGAQLVQPFVASRHRILVHAQCWQESTRGHLEQEFLVGVII